LKKGKKLKKREERAAVEILGLPQKASLPVSSQRQGHAVTLTRSAQSI